jgi:hypothetical protein
MNRIRKINNNTYEVLITPSIKIAPDSSLMVGNWSDPNLRGYMVLRYPTMNDAMTEAFKHPDIDWYRFVVNHEPIFIRLRMLITGILNDMIPDKVQIRAQLMDPTTLKNTMMDRVILNGERFNLKEGLADLISFTIISPFTSTLHKISNVLERYRSHLYLDELRIRDKRVIDGKIIYLYAMTDIGTVYQIKLIPTLLDQVGPLNYPKMISLQNNLDRSTQISL